MINTDQLTKFGVIAYAILAFDNQWSADTTAGLGEAAERLRLDTRDKNQARDLCARYDLNAADLGDDAPAIVFDQPITVKRPEVRAAVLAWHDAREGDSNDDEHAAAGELIAALLDYAGMRFPG